MEVDGDNDQCAGARPRLGGEDMVVTSKSFEINGLWGNRSVTGRETIELARTRVNVVNMVKVKCELT
jgi:hypothetical protein